jgi:hypothetical protein
VIGSAPAVLPAAVAVLPLHEGVVGVERLMTFNPAHGEMVGHVDEFRFMQVPPLLESELNDRNWSLLPTHIDESLGAKVTEHLPPEGEHVHPLAGQLSLWLTDWKNTVELDVYPVGHAACPVLYTQRFAPVAVGVGRHAWSAEEQALATSVASPQSRTGEVNDADPPLGVP